jgi:hypothetical protein
VRRAEAAGSGAVESKRVVFLLQQLGIRARDELDRVVADGRPGTAQPHLAEAAATNEADKAVAIDLQSGSWGEIVRWHAAI